MFALILALVAAGGSVWVGIRGYKSAAALREIEGVGGRAELVRLGPGWLRQRVGGTWLLGLDEIVGVNLDGTAARCGGDAGNRRWIGPLAANGKPPGAPAGTHSRNRRGSGIAEAS